jgi:hypothetical protein
VLLKIPAFGIGVGFDFSVLLCVGYVFGYWAKRYVPFSILVEMQVR